jgi:multiple sugar transport system ATP-binding protein
VYLFDEPPSNLDAKLRVQMRIEIKKVHQTVRTTTVYVTQDQVEAITIADGIVLMNQIRIEQVGPSQRHYDQPASLSQTFRVAIRTHFRNQLSAE